MMWLDLIDILYLVVGVIFGYILSYLINRDALDDECDTCLYREYVMEVIKHERDE